MYTPPDDGTVIRDLLRDLERYIIRYKPQYYKLLQQVRTESAWVPWIEFMITAVEQTAQISS